MSTLPTHYQQLSSSTVPWHACSAGMYIGTHSGGKITKKYSEVEKCFFNIVRSLPTVQKKSNFVTYCNMILDTITWYV